MDETKECIKYEYLSFYIHIHLSNESNQEDFTYKSVTRDKNSYFQKEFSSVDGHLYSFYPSVTRLWNNLPTEVRNCGKLEQFSNNLQKINLTELRQCLQSID